MIVLRAGNDENVQQIHSHWMETGGMDFVDSKYLEYFLEKCGYKISALVGN